MANQAIVSNKFLLHYFRLTFDLHFTVTLTNNIPRVPAFKTKFTWIILGGGETEKNKDTQEYPVAGNNESHFLCNWFQERSNMRERSQAEGFRAPNKMDSPKF